MIYHDRSMIQNQTVKRTEDMTPGVPGVENASRQESLMMASAPYVLKYRP